MAKLLTWWCAFLLIGVALGASIAGDKYDLDPVLEDDEDYADIPLGEALSDDTVDDPVAFASTSNCARTRTYVSRVYVYRRPLAPLKYLIKIAPLAHSGLILKLITGQECVLEYMGDGQAHLYDAKYRTTGWSWWSKLRKAYNLHFTDYLGDTYTSGVTRQYYGTALPSSVRVKPSQVKGIMQRQMGSTYNLFTNNCHLAQEKTRRALGLSVEHPYIFPYNQAQLCRLINDRSQGKALLHYLYNPYAALLVRMCHITG